MSVENIGKKMLTQENRMTQYPLFVIMVDEKIARSPDWDWDDKERVDIDCLNGQDLCENCMKILENDQDLPPECDDCDDGAFDFFQVKRVPDLRAGVFFTLDACQKHIDANDYHYVNPKPFVVGAWRNEEMQQVMQHLCSLAGEIPSHYR